MNMAFYTLLNQPRCKPRKKHDWAASLVNGGTNSCGIGPKGLVNYTHCRNCGAQRLTILNFCRTAGIEHFYDKTRLPLPILPDMEPPEIRQRR